MLLVLILLFGFLILILPLALILTLIGITFKGIGVLLLFSLKYLLPFGIIGYLIAKRRDRKSYLSWKGYVLHMGLALAAGFVVLLMFLKIPVTPKFPSPDEIKTMSSLRKHDGGTETETVSTEERWIIEDLLQSLSSLEYKRTIKEFITDDEDYVYQYILTLTDDEGKDCKFIFYNPKFIGIRKNGITFHYQVKDDSGKLPMSLAAEVLILEKRAIAEAILGPFSEELFSTILYDEAYQTVAFTIPETIPEERHGIFIRIEGVRGYTGGEFNPYGMSVFEEEQRQNLWEAGKQYAINLEDECFSRFEITVNSSYLKEGYTFDVLSLLPEDRVHK